MPQAKRAALPAMGRAALSGYRFESALRDGVYAISALHASTSAAFCAADAACSGALVFT